MSNLSTLEGRLTKSVLRKIEISELPKKIPNYKRSFESKDIVIYNWIKNWIIDGLKSNALQINELLPNKADMAYHLGVSIGTVQNAIRYVEDEGYLESKQRIGTLIKDINSSDNKFRKLTSKREKAIIELKKLIIENNYKIDETIPSARNITAMLGTSSNTTRLALEHLASKGIIKSNYFRGIESNWILTEIPNLTDDEKEIENGVETDTLVSKVEADLKEFIQKNYKVGDKLCSHAELSEILEVSIKTVHDAMKILIEEGILLARRGRYGTTILRLPSDHPLQPTKETTIFAPAQDAAFYSYQKIENHLKNMIKNKYQIGDKIPSMEQLSQELDVSTNTIKKALQNLNEQGYVEFVRGRYGGTFISEVPEDATESAFKWLAVNPQYVKVYKN